jgi:hypothetical protein
MTDGATRGSADGTMPRKMTSNAANDRTLDASLGVSRGREHEKRSRHHCARKNLLHWFVSPAHDQALVKHRGEANVPGACCAGSLLGKDRDAR